MHTYVNAGIGRYPEAGSLLRGIVNRALIDGWHPMIGTHTYLCVCLCVCMYIIYIYIYIWTYVWVRGLSRGIVHRALIDGWHPMIGTWKKGFTHLCVCVHVCIPACGCTYVGTYTLHEHALWRGGAFEIFMQIHTYMHIYAEKCTRPYSTAWAHSMI